ncbi:branched-chain amino acid ABC transporter permease [Reyranella sp. CPCC 100927]|uniref:branched-chain amino acid ABC transporter permease n=1 Tax=Reyranella sp. CPCC 100927 TaxID=2599616 RepID=UPI0011B362FC|nr:branched-chain amino acid ABC transporter permease [Reyranella sp. CPCC 100927]TWS96299.1 branched-chain amino acid ABC transporter permease [Reyranella sp. CPCC 100927]
MSADPGQFVVTLLQAIAMGLLTGMVYGLMALGLSVIFGVMRVVNFAHGEMMVVGMYLAWLAFDRLGLDPLVSLPAVAAALFVFGYVLQRTVINPFIGLPEHMQFMLLLAVAILLVNACLAIAGPDTHGVQVDYMFDSFNIGPLVLDAVRVYAALAALVVAGLLWLFFTRTRPGKAIRAAADNHIGALVVGLDVRQLYALTFGIGAACVGAAGALMLLIVQVHPFLAIDYTLLAFVIVIVGGLGSMSGALAGGLLIGVSEAVAGVLLQPSLKSVFSFGLLIIVLLLRPQGLLARRS